MKRKGKIEEIVGRETRMVLEEIMIDNKEYSLKITNRYGGKLVLSFNRENREEYKIMIKEGQITFERNVYRSDHDDEESLQVSEKDKTISWRARPPYHGEGFDFFKVEFGSKMEPKS